MIQNKLSLIITEFDFSVVEFWMKTKTVLYKQDLVVKINELRREYNSHVFEGTAVIL